MKSQGAPPLLLLRCLFFYEARYGFVYKAEHVPGRCNRAADALSRDNVNLFFTLIPQAQSQATMISGLLVEALGDKTIRWTSPRWKKVFTDSLRRV